MVKHAFTMIELIFAIVIIGIISMTIPMVMVNNAKNIEQNLLQEAILVLATKTGQALSYPWDENSNPSGGIFLAKTEALNINEATIENELARSVSDFRVGHFQQPLRRKLTPLNAERDATDNTLLGLDAGDGNSYDDIDDFNGQSVVINQINELGYKNDYNVTGIVFYVDDRTDYGADGGGIGGNTNLNFTFTNTNAGRATNIKMVELNVRGRDSAGNWNSDPDIVFRTFVSNLGETDYYKRTY